MRMRNRGRKQKVSKKLGLALGAGGSRGVSHIGFLKAMDEEGIVPDFIAGSSMGSVVGSCYAAGMKPDDMFNEVMKLKFNEIFGLTLNPLGQGALSRTTRMKKKLDFFLNENEVTVVYPIAVKRWVVFVDPKTGETRILNEKKRRHP